MTALPTGTVTFLFTDIEGSTRLLQETGERFADLLATHSRLMRQAITLGGGVEVRTEGDAFFVAFPSAVGAATTAVAAQQALAGHPWPPDADVRVRMGMHTGNGVLGGDDYIGLDVHRAARVAGTAHGGQIVASEATARLVESHLPPGVGLQDLGEHRLKDIPRPERIFQFTIPGLPSEFPPLTSLEIPSNLPDDLSSFVGRRQELEQAIGLLEANRLLTLTGPGGTGKTRLSLQVARRLAERFSDGVFFVPMAETRDALRIPTEILETMGAMEGDSEGSMDLLLSKLDTKHLLLVLDNLEQVDDPAPIIGRLLGGARNVKLLVTSRIPLRVSGEQEMGVPPMAVPTVGATGSPEDLLEFDSVALFVDRARSVRPDFTITEENGAAVAGLCARLDGLPLGLEIAAARVKLFPPNLILQRLGSVLDSTGAKNVPSRQQTLRNAIAWSYDLLDDPMRLLFDRMAVFAGGAGFAELDAVCASLQGVDLVDGVSALVDHSLVAQSMAQGEPRFGMLSTIREFAAERLEASGTADEARRSHAVAYLDFAEAGHPELTGADRDEWLDRFALESHNLDAALSWAIEQGEGETALRLVSSLWRFWQMRGNLRDALRQIESALALSGEDSEVRAKALEAAGGVAYWMGDMERTRTFYEQALECWKQDEDELGIANALLNLSYPLLLVEGPDAGADVLQQALASFERLGERQSIGRVSRVLGMVESGRGNYEAWAQHCRRALEHFDPVTESFDYGWALFCLAGASFSLGQIGESEDAVRRGLELFSGSGDLSAMAMFLTAAAQNAYSREDHERVARLVGAVAKLREDTGGQQFTRSLPGDWLDLDHLEAVAHRHPDPFEEGRGLTLKAAVAYALSS